MPTLSSHSRPPPKVQLPGGRARAPAPPTPPRLSGTERAAALKGRARGAVRAVRAGRGESSRAGPGSRRSPQGEAGRVCRRRNERKVGSFETDREQERNRNSDKAMLALAVSRLLARQCASQLCLLPVPAAFQSLLVKQKGKNRMVLCFRLGAQKRCFFWRV